ncbi:tRNA acetyltransferase TAN1 [Fistulifera solaris]|uniref:tRNA acetyltransferase TAN1 n=1 Tax=Fistulifera solaris TaxID=1519565 RepID=A0A1Z5JGE8_FISSO|nr:tRNA acetyltransferase TAN1 [Fistulifera solaris]|eukprot:GAX13059.1 tRNA acetyltransferase TAN1 [Fistulifera solaris]
MTPQPDNRGTKRKNKSRYLPHCNPPRGAAGILLTCEQRREGKCRREGLDILKYYSEQSFPSASNEKQEEKLSLEDELKALTSKKTGEKSFFSQFETGCKGTVLFLFHPEQESQETNGSQEKGETESSVEPAKRQRVETTTTVSDAVPDNKEEITSFDPVKMVTQILRDTHDNSSQSRGLNIPGSRFVTRIIPLQVTCSVSLEEITTTVANLTERFLKAMSKEQKMALQTFAVQIKRRNCGHVKRMDMIVAVADQVAKTANELLQQDWRVDLTNPDVTVWVEVCKSICGISVFSKETLELAPNWNIAELRGESAVDDDE